mgnify:CR=1 FL=1
MLIIFDVEGVLLDEEYLPILAEKLNKEDEIWEITKQGIPYMKINESKIRIDPDSSLPTIASKLFDESKKQKGAVKSIEKLMKKTEEKLEKTIEKGEIARGSVGFKEVRKKSWYERYRWFFTSDGVLAVGGRDESGSILIFDSLIFM